jgi:hypothetical protein
MDAESFPRQHIVITDMTESNNICIVITDMTESIILILQVKQRGTGICVWV